jgi:KDO2-lipid IV(A) lauroyltransferase
MLAVDVLYTPRLVKKRNWRQYSSFRNTERAKWLMKQGTGVLMVSAHYGNFEIPGYMMGLFGFNIYSIARPLDNRFISNYLYGVRERVGQKMIDKKGAAELMGKLTAEGATLGFGRRRHSRFRGRPGCRKKRHLRRFLRTKGQHLQEHRPAGHHSQYTDSGWLQQKNR